MKKVLILEDEVSIRSFVVINLKRAGYEPIEAGTGREALEKLKENPDTGVAILDIMLPDIDGFEVCRSIRATNKTIGIIMLTARTQEMDKVTGLMTGADDYVTKPFSPAGALPPHRRRRGEQPGDHRPRALHAEHPQPHAGKGRPPHQADAGRICNYPAIHAESRPRAVPRGYSDLRLGQRV